jgi:hypothetical protein
MGYEQGALFYLLGSDADSLRPGMDALNRVLEEYAANPIANYVRLVQGVNLARTFKTIKERGSGLQVRKADTAAATKLIVAAVAETSPIDTVTKSQSLQKLAIAQETAGDKEGASKSSELAASFMPKRKKEAAAPHA